MNRDIKIVDLFAGIGGIRLGFENASKNKIHCVFTSEWDKYSKETYQENYNNEEVFVDITQINENEIQKTMFYWPLSLVNRFHKLV